MKRPRVSSRHGGLGFYHEAMMYLFFGVYNFCKVHGTLKTTPAVAAGITDHVWTVRELIEKTSGTH